MTDGLFGAVPAPVLFVPCSMVKLYIKRIKLLCDGGVCLRLFIPTAGSFSVSLCVTHCVSLSHKAVIFGFLCVFFSFLSAANRSDRKASCDPYNRGLNSKGFPKLKLIIKPRHILIRLVCFLLNCSRRINGRLCEGNCRKVWSVLHSEKRRRKGDRNKTPSEKLNLFFLQLKHVWIFRIVFVLYIFNHL